MQKSFRVEFLPSAANYRIPDMANAVEGQGWHITGAVGDGKNATGGDCV